MNASAKKTILVIEDTPDILECLRVFLESEGYTVLLAENGRVALEKIQKHGMPRLILLDMKMPVMNGWEFATEFINRHDNATPIVVMTAAADAKQRAKDVHAIDWVGKPFSFDDLLSKVKMYESP